MNLKYKIGTSIATGALLGALLTGSAFAQDLEISGNGAGSDNTIEVSNSNGTAVLQGNNLEVETEVISVANSGGNTANKNTGGDVSIDTGNATSNVTVSVSGGSNTATVEPCPCDNTQSAEISGNGADSKNKIKQNNSNKTFVGQFNNVGVSTGVLSLANSGKNKANKNTGGSTDVTTGRARSRVNVSVIGPSNTLNP